MTIREQVEANREKIEQEVIQAIKNELHPKEKFFEMETLNINPPYAYAVYTYYARNGEPMVGRASIRISREV